MSQVHIRWMIRKDVDRVMEIENDSFLCPWSVDDLIDRMRQRNCVGMVAEIDGEVVGYMVYELHKSRLELINLAVDPTYRNQGVGSAMLHKLTGKLASERRHTLALQVSEKNTHAHLFFSRHGMLATKVVKGLYGPDCDEDSYRFEFDVKQPGAVVCVS